MYRPNVSDKQQTDIENALNDSAIRIPWFDGKLGQTGMTKFVRSYDLQQQHQATVETPTADNRKMLGHIIGSHNDRPSVFENPGKA